MGAEKSLAGRNLAMDWLRGLCLVLMTVDHLPDSLFDRFSNSIYGPFGFFSAMLGFVFISGWATGLVYTRYQQAYGFRGVIRHALGRCAKIYVVNASLFSALVLAVVFRIEGTPGWRQFDVIRRHPWERLAMGYALLYQPQFLDVLPLYCIFLLAAPLALWQMQAGRTRGLLWCSSAFWLLSGLAYRHGAPVGFFNPFAYLFLFLIGMAVSVRRVGLEDIRPTIRKRLIVAATALTMFFFCFVPRTPLAGRFMPMSITLVVGSARPSWGRYGY